MQFIVIFKIKDIASINVFNMVHSSFQISICGWDEEASER